MAPYLRLHAHVALPGSRTGGRRRLGAWALLLWMLLAALPLRAWAVADLIGTAPPVASLAESVQSTGGMPPCHGMAADRAAGSHDAAGSEAGSAPCECCHLCSGNHPAPEALHVVASRAAEAAQGELRPPSTRALPDGLFRPPRS